MAGEWSRGTATLIPNIAPFHTIANAMNLIGSFLTQTGWVEASWSPGTSDRYWIRADRATQDHWRFDGDGPTQHCGIHAQQQNGDTEIHISCFLENQAEDDSQVDTFDFAHSTFRQARSIILFDVTAPNNWLFIGGEDGLYIEAGRDGNPNNLGHTHVATWGVQPELNSTREFTRRWSSQGFVLDLFGPCKFTEGLTTRNLRYVINDGTSRNFTAYYQGIMARGSGSLATPGPTDYRGIRFGSRDLMNGLTGFGSSAEHRYLFCFGHFNSPEDDRFRISPIQVTQISDNVDIAASSSSSSDVVPASTNPDVRCRDIRNHRKMRRVVVVDYTLLPFINIVEAQSGVTYRVVEHNDSGRTANLGVEWPAVVVVPSLT